MHNHLKLCNILSFGVIVHWGRASQFHSSKNTFLNNGPSFLDQGFIDFATLYVPNFSIHAKISCCCCWVFWIGGHVSIIVFIIDANAWILMCLSLDSVRFIARFSACFTSWTRAFCESRQWLQEARATIRRRHSDGQSCVMCWRL